MADNTRTNREAAQIIKRNIEFLIKAVVSDGKYDGIENLLEARKQVSMFLGKHPITDDYLI